MCSSSSVVQQIKANRQKQQDPNAVRDAAEISWLAQVFLIKISFSSTLTLTLACYEVFQCSLYTLNTNVSEEIAFQCVFQLYHGWATGLRRILLNSSEVQENKKVLSNAFRYHTWRNLFKIHTKNTNVLHRRFTVHFYYRHPIVSMCYWSAECFML